MAMVKVMQAYRFALDPSPAQERMLRSHAGAARFAWNRGLAKCQARHAGEGKWYSAAELHKMWNTEKKADPELAWWDQNSKCVYQEAFRDLDRALREFIRSKKGQRKGGRARIPPLQEARPVQGLVPVRRRGDALLRHYRDAAPVEDYRHP